MKNKILFTALALICLIGLISVASAGKETQLTQDQRLVVSTAIYDNIITWYETSANSVNIYDLTKGKMLDIPEGYGGVAGNIPIYGSKVVWHDMGDNITMYDISTNKITQIATSSYDPDIHGNNIVYVKSISDPNYPYTQYYSVFLYNVTSNEETQITEYGRFGYKPIIHGNKIVWSRTDWSRPDENSETSIYVYDIPTRQTNIVSENITPSNLLNAYNQLDFYGNIVVWSDVQNGKSDIYMQDISTHKTTQITNSGIASNPAIYDKYIVYDSFYRMSDVYVTDIYMYNISTGETTQITKCGCAWSPSIYKNQIAYVDSHADGTYNFEAGNIYLYDLSAESEKPTATFNANVTSGVAPLRVQFTSTTTGNPTDYYWVFEPSTSSDWNSHHAVTAVHTFTHPGVYNVTLTVTNDAGSYTATREGYITVTDASGSAGKPVANFNSPLADAELNDLTDHGIYENEVVSFFDNSTGSPTSWFWDFGDGNTSTQQNPIHVYGKRGGYTVTLTAGNAAGNDTISKYGYVLVGTGDAPASPAYFSSDKTSGNAPLAVTFVDDRDAEFPNYPIWRMWDFGDGVIQTYMVDSNASATPYATHIYEKPGKYSVTLYLDNRGGKSIITKYNYITVTDPAIPVANFSVNVTSGTAPLVVLFTDTSTGEAPTSWFWDFGDGINSKHAMNATHTFATPGIYTVNLTVENAAGNNMVTKPNYIVVTDPNVPVPNFSCSVTKGYAPLTVQFTDLSQKATSRIWDFNNDGQTDSSDAAPVYTYAVPGTYTAKLTAINANGTVSKTATITVLKEGSSNGGNSGGSSGGSGGGGGGSPEPAKNVEVKELAQAFITGDKEVKFDFTRNATCVVYVSFDAKKTLGKTTTIAEMLKGKSALVSELPSGEVYKSFNVWVGNGGVASSKNIKNPVVCFKVEKSWMQNKSVDPASIILNMYSDKKWEQLPVNISREDNEYIYFTAKTPEFSSFAIIGTSKKSSEEPESQLQTGSKTGTVNQDNTGDIKLEAELEAEQETENQDSRSLPGFEIYCTVIGLLAVFRYKRK